MVSVKTFALLAFICLGSALAASSSSSNKNNSNSNHLDKKSDPVLSIISMFRDEARSLARLDASLKSVLGNPLTGLVYAASLAIGVVTLLAFYESPISPLPVPALPKPPVGRFPPEHSVWPPVSKQAVKLNAGPAYSTAGSQLSQAFALPPTFEKSHFTNAYQPGAAAAGVAGAAGLQQPNPYVNLGGLTAAGSNLYASVLPAPQRGVPAGGAGQHLQNGLLQGQLQASSFQRKSSELSPGPLPHGRPIEEVNNNAGKPVLSEGQGQGVKPEQPVQS